MKLYFFVLLDQFFFLIVAGEYSLSVCNNPALYTSSAYDRKNNNDNIAVNQHQSLHSAEESEVAASRPPKKGKAHRATDREFCSTKSTCKRYGSCSDLHSLLGPLATTDDYCLDIHCGSVGIRLFLLYCTVFYMHLTGQKQMGALKTQKNDNQNSTEGRSYLPSSVHRHLTVLKFRCHI